MTQPLHPWRKIPWYPLDRKLGGLQSRSGHHDEEKMPQPPLAFKSLVVI